MIDALQILFDCVLRQAQHERNYSMLQTLTVRPELVEGQICERIMIDSIRDTLCCHRFLMLRHAMR